MYSYEDHIRAVKLYIKLGKRTGSTIRQLGYPTRKSLKSWHAEYERCFDLPRGYENVKSKYSLAQRELRTADRGFDLSSKYALLELTGLPTQAASVRVLFREAAERIALPVQTSVCQADFTCRK